MEGVTSLAVLTNGSAFGVKDGVFLRCFFAVRSVHHHKTTVTQSLQRRAEMGKACRVTPLRRRGFLTAEKPHAE